MPNNFIAVKCPHCGMEYLPCEIFYPNSLLGVPKNIIKDPLGKILLVEWAEKGEPSPDETFVCENCEHTFVAIANLSFKTEAGPEALDFKHQAVSLF